VKEDAQASSQGRIMYDFFTNFTTTNNGRNGGRRAVPRGG
jgi:hypothetical protein